jgi:hypothetical protein
MKTTFRMESAKRHRGGTAKDEVERECGRRGLRTPASEQCKEKNLSRRTHQGAKFAVAPSRNPGQSLLPAPALQGREAHCTKHSETRGRAATRVREENATRGIFRRPAGRPVGEVSASLSLWRQELDGTHYVGGEFLVPVQHRRGVLGRNDAHVEGLPIGNA